MGIVYFPFGEPYPDLSPDHLLHSITRKTLTACARSSDFDILELRHKVQKDGTVSDIIIVDCINDQIGSRNPVGIKIRERLALIFAADQDPEVRALRKDFPIVPHINQVLPNEPISICLYFEPWSAVERTWTPQKHLQRILWWLSETAKGRLHRNDQPLEDIYYNFPYEIVLPPDFENKIKDFNLELIPLPGTPKIFRCGFIPKKSPLAKESHKLDILMINCAPVVHRNIEQYPYTMGDLHDQFVSRDAPFLNDLRKILQEKANGGITHNPQKHCLLLLTIPLKRNNDSDPESIKVKAFFIDEDVPILGEKLGVLSKHDGRYFSIPIIGDVPIQTGSDEWRNIKISPIEVKIGVSKESARITSAINEHTSDFNGILAGVGALGSALADIWSKGFWGEWTFIDKDIIKSHNVIRHIARDHQIGQFKVDTIKELVEMNYHPGYYSATAIPENILNPTDQRIVDAIEKANLLVDVTTTLEVPRELSQRDDVPRSVSVFFTPTGNSSVLLFEDIDRSIRLDVLEAQYYKAIINSPWGENHLTGHQGILWAGAGCRDISVILSYEIVLFHASILAKQIRLIRDKKEPSIRIWNGNLDTGEIRMQDILLVKPIMENLRDWQIVWDTGIKERLENIRKSHLPNETGGIILGYIDQKSKKIYVVDIREAPPDSEADQTGFVRGVDGLNDILNDASHRTANIVGYIGEWHSHPPFTAASPSKWDRSLLDYLSQKLSSEGQPALMIIVGSAGEVSLSLKEG